MKKKSNPSRKPTMSEVKDAINSLIKEYTSMAIFLNRLDATLASYIQFNKNSNEFKEWLNEQLTEELSDESGKQDSGKSNGGDTKAKVKNIKSRKGESESKS